MMNTRSGVPKMRARGLVPAGLVLAGMTWVGLAGFSRAEVPPVVVTIKPVHALVSSVMQGVGIPYLIVDGARSPHNFSLEPSVARRIARAKVIFWVGEQLERFMVKPIRTLGRKAAVVEVADLPGIRVLDAREGGIQPKHRHRHQHRPKKREHRHSRGHGHGHNHGGKDMHLWLDVDNALTIVRAAGRSLSAADPGNAARYGVNVDATVARLMRLDRELKAMLKPVRNRPFIVFHDAYQYFERRYRLAAAGSIVVDPARPPGARRLVGLRRYLKANRVRCVFSEPQFPQKFVATVIAGTDARQGMLDPIGVTEKPGLGAYRAMMRRIGKSLVNCLTQR